MTLTSWDKPKPFLGSAKCEIVKYDTLSNLRVTSWCKEIETGVDASVMVSMQQSLHFQFLL